VEESEWSTVRYEVDDGIATVTLHRPERLNAFTLQMGHELVAVLDRIDADDDVRAAIFTGSGRAFCAGADLEGDGEIFSRDGAVEFDMMQHPDLGGVVARRMFASIKPLIAAVNGPAVGVGASLLLPMDVRLMADSARIGFVFTRRGLVPESCSSWFLPRIVGISRAAEWVYSGRIFDADEALRTGLVRSVHPRTALMSATRELAHAMTRDSAPVAVALARQMLWRMLGVDGPGPAHVADSHGIFALGRSPDAIEGVRAFLAKRPARFSMRPSADLPDLFPSTAPDADGA
jgi:enoyl-CoA hydratase/carnithine racemase